MSWVAIGGSAIGAVGSIIGGSKKPQSTTEKTTSTETHKQDDQYNNLLGSADSWLAGGGLGDQPNLTGNMSGVLEQMGQGYMDQISGAGSGDRYQALQDMNAASAAQSQAALGKSLNQVGMQAGAVGGAQGSRRGLAEGIAAGEAATGLAQIQSQQNQNFLQQEEAIRQQGLQGMSGLFGQVGQLQEQMQANTPEAQRIKELMAYQQMIAGDMGGTTNSTSTVSASDKRLKKKIKKVKTKKGKPVKTKDGVPISSWEWNEKAKKKYGLSGKGTGVLAQDAKKKRPDAVVKNDIGDYEVKYGALV